MRQPVISFAFIGAISFLFASCASVEVTRTSASTMIIDTSGDPSCGSSGTAKVASMSAAVETLRAGYDRYIITGDAAANNTYRVTNPGTYETTNKFDRDGTLVTRSRYIPGSTYTSGSYDRSMEVKMFRQGDSGYNDAIDARSVLGPDWQRLVRNGVRTCG